MGMPWWAMRAREGQLLGEEGAAVLRQRTLMRHCLGVSVGLSSRNFAPRVLRILLTTSKEVQFFGLSTAKMPFTSLGASNGDVRSFALPDCIAVLEGPRFFRS